MVDAAKSAAGGLSSLSVVASRVSLWEALAGRAPGRPVGPADPGLWAAVSERLDPARARPVLRRGVEQACLVSARGGPYVMLRSPDERGACYLRLAPEEARLADLMDGSRTVARLVAEFARVTGVLAPDRVRRVVADLAGNRMLQELPVDAFAPLERVRHVSWPLRLGRGLLAFARGRRMVLTNVEPLVSFLYRAGGRLLFTRVAGVVLALVAVAGLGLFGWQWWAGARSVFLSDDSYVLGAAILLGLNVFALACHELGHALAAKHAGRRVPAAGFLVYFGIPSVFVDTSDVWMAGRRGRLLTTASGPGAGLVLAGTSALVGFFVPAAAPICFKLSFAWYLNALFNLNPFIALDGYYLLLDWLELPNLRARGIAWVAGRLRRRPPRWSQLDREGRLVALYGLLALAWIVVALNVAYRVYADRVAGLITGLWRSGWPARLLLAAVVAALASPLVYLLFGWLARRWRRLRAALRERRIERDRPRRLAALYATGLRALSGTQLAALAAQARWLHPRTGEPVVLAGAPQHKVFVVAAGLLEGRAHGDPAGTVRRRVGPGGLVGVGPALAGAPSPLDWYTAGTTLLALPAPALVIALGSAPGGGTHGRAVPGRGADGRAVPGRAAPFGTAEEADALLAGNASVTSAAPLAGVHPAAVYPPLAAPPAPPSPGTGDDVDRRFERRLLWWLVLVAATALCFTAGNALLPATGWAEMPGDKALVRVTAGTATAVASGVAYDLSAGDDIYLGAADEISVDSGSRALVVFRGGAQSLLCAGTELGFGALSSTGDPITPSARVRLRRGLVINTTASTSTAFTDLALRVDGAAGVARNEGAAFFAASPLGVRISSGLVRLDGAAVAPVGGDLTCDGVALAAPATGTGTPAPEPTPTPSPTPEPTPTPTPVSSPTPAATTSRPTLLRTTPPATIGPTSPITIQHVSSDGIVQQAPSGFTCQATGDSGVGIQAQIVNPQGNPVAWYTLPDGARTDINYSRRLDTYVFTVGPIPYQQDATGVIRVYIQSTDSVKTWTETVDLRLLACDPADATPPVIHGEPTFDRTFFYQISPCYPNSVSVTAQVTDNVDAGEDLTVEAWYGGVPSKMTSDPNGGKGQYTGTVDSIAISGTLEVDVRATDRAGNSTSKGLSIEVADCLM